jgi:hypothetical protein
VVGFTQPWTKADSGTLPMDGASTGASTAASGPAASSSPTG